MTSIERTAYPQFKRLTSARVLHVFFTPMAEEIAWARERTASPESLFALVLALKCFQKMARFCSREEIPEVVVDHVRRCLGLGPEVEPDHGAARTARWPASRCGCGRAWPMTSGGRGRWRPGRSGTLHVIPEMLSRQSYLELVTFAELVITESNGIALGFSASRPGKCKEPGRGGNIQGVVLTAPWFFSGMAFVPGSSDTRSSWVR